MNDKVVIAGHVKLKNTIKAKTNLHNTINGTPSWVVNTGGGSQPTGTKSILLTEAGTKTEDVTAYASAEINAVTDASASGAVASFSDGADDVPMDSCLVNIEPVQSGSGDPSPSNVRPISGWSEVNVYVSPTQSAQDATVHTVSLGQTVYGGTLDVVSGVLTVDRAVVDMASITDWTVDKSIQRIYKILSYIKPNTSVETIPNMLCNRFKTITPYNVYAKTMQGVTVSTGFAIQFHIDGLTDRADVTLTEINQYFTDNPTQVVYELATPTTVQLTPTEVTTLLGSNNVWADSGDIAVGYKADVYLTEGSTPTGTKQIAISSNGTVTEDVTSYANAEINVNVPASAVDTGTKNISTNGTHDVVGYANASVNVPNSYSSADEGKVVSNGALVSQTSDTVTENGVVDTTLIDELTVNVSGGGGVDTLAARCNGTLATYSSDAITTVANYAFTDSGIQSLELPNCTEIGNNGLRGLTSLTDLKIHNVTKLSTDALNGDSALTVLAIPKCTSMTTRSLNGNTNLHTLETGVLHSVTASAQIATLILRKSSVVALNATTYLNSGIWGSSGTGGTLYVPSDLISSYQSATNWSTILGYANNSIQAIEGSQYENYYADGTPISS